MKKFLGLFLILTFFTFSAQAEYRVFLLRISKLASPAPGPNSPAAPGTNSPNPSPANSENSTTEAPVPNRQPASTEPTDFRLVESTLDPVQYRGYYLVASDEVIEYIDTWMCTGRTNQFTGSHCPNPKAQIPAE